MKKKKVKEHENLERWVISYADFMTLLFAFFVVMYAIANQDKAKVKQIKRSIEENFFGSPGKLDLGTGATVHIRDRPSSRGHILNLPAGRRIQREVIKKLSLKEIAHEIEESIAYQLQTTDLKDRIEFVYDYRGLVIRMVGNHLFLPGRADVQRENLPLIDKIAKVIKKTDRFIRVEGHTDSIPIAEGGRFPTNWELSSSRASWITRYMIAKYQISPYRFSAGGYAGGQPVASNDTAEGRAQNRRIEIIVTNLRKD